jgi:hypothetical protein
MRERIREMCNDGAGVEEQAVQALYGCWRELYLAVYRMYDMTDDSWEPAGKIRCMQRGQAVRQGRQQLVSRRLLPVR